MNKAEAASILGIAAGFDRYIQVDDLNTTAWYTVLADYDFSDVRQSVVEFYSRMWDGRSQLAPRVLLEEVRNKIATDVRVAKRIGLIPREWLESERVTPAVHRDLLVYRTAKEAWERQNPIGFNNHETFAEFCARSGYVYESKALVTA